MTATLCLSKHRENNRIISVYTNTALVGLIKDLGYRLGYRMLNINNIECIWYGIQCAQKLLENQRTSIQCFDFTTQNSQSKIKNSVMTTVQNIVCIEAYRESERIDSVFRFYNVKFAIKDIEQCHDNSLVRQQAH